MQQKRLNRITDVIKNRQSGLVVVLEDIHDPHNAAAILRTCDAMGVQYVNFVFENEKPYNPRKIGKTTSSSANKWLDFEVFDTMSSCFNTLKKKKFTTIGTGFTPNATSLLSATFDYTNIALLVGNEHRGLSDYALTHAEHIISIPMLGFVQSLNVSVATAILLWEITKQRNTHLQRWKLSKQHQKKLFERYLKK